MKALHTIAFVLLIVGGLNWGLEFFGWGVGNVIPSGLASLIYLLVGIAALFEVFTHKSYCKHCEVKPPMQPM
jgi:uncharacterized membrane protein YuzA (DUF378 family)